VVRFTRLHQTGFEAVGMDLKDHANPRRLLVSLSRNDRRYARSQITVENRRIAIYLISRLLVVSGFINISNEVGRVKSVSLFFYFFRTHLYSCAVPLLSLTGDAPQFSGCSSCPTYGLGSCHFIVSVLSTRHLSDHVRP
jgi:hypothetical protein